MGRKAKGSVRRDQIVAGTSSDDAVEASRTDESTGESNLKSSDAKEDETVFDPTTAEGGHREPVAGPFDTPAQPETPDETPVAGEPRRKRGRPPGSSNRAPKVLPINVSGVEQLLLGIHTTLFMATSIPELELSENEAREIAKAYNEAVKHYPILNVDPKHAALLNLGSVLSITYGSRVIAWKARTAKPSTQRSQSAAPPQPQNTMNGQSPPMPSELQQPSAPKVNVGEIPGVGNVEFPPDHDLVRGRRN